MDEPLAALQEWWKLVKPEGVLFLVVPDEDLYEQGFWPSRFNPDHKWTLTICKHQSWSPVSINLWEAVRSLPDSQIEDIRLQDNGYRRYLLANGSRPGSVAYIVKNLVGRLFYGLLKCTGIDKNRLREWLRHPVDQTKWADRCAQIQCIVRKVSTTA